MRPTISWPSSGVKSSSVLRFFAPRFEGDFFGLVREALFDWSLSDRSCESSSAARVRFLVVVDLAARVFKRLFGGGLVSEASEASMSEADPLLSDSSSASLSYTFDCRFWRQL